VMSRRSIDDYNAETSEWTPRAGHCEYCSNNH